MKFHESSKKRCLELKVIISLLTILSILLIPNPAKSEEIVARVNGEEITPEQLSERARIDHLFMTLRGAPLFAEFLMETDRGQSVLKHYRSYVLDRVIEDTIVIQRAEEIGIDVSEEEIEKRLNGIIEATENVDNRKELLSDLKGDRRDLNDLKKEIYRRIIREKLRRKVVEDVEVSTQDIKEFYEKNRKTFRDARDRIQPLEEVRDLIRERLIVRKKGKAWNEWLEDAKKEANVVKYLTTANN
jgi:parvulin-like peptidyl-prolyl isomerase